MITQFLFSIIIMVLKIVFGWLPDANTLPTFLGVNLDTIFSNGIGYIRYLATIFPPLTSIMLAAGIYISWKIILKVLKLVLGHRSPAHADA